MVHLAPLHVKVATCLIRSASRPKSHPVDMALQIMLMTSLATVGG